LIQGLHHKASKPSDKYYKSHSMLTLRESRRQEFHQKSQTKSA